NEVVCRVNTEVISKRDVEIRMLNNGQAMLNLFMFRERLKSDDQWTEENQQRFNELYIPAFRDELRNAIREKLMLHDAKSDKVEVPKAMFEKRYEAVLDNYRKQGLLNKPGFKLEEIRDRLKDQLLLEEFRDQFINVFDMPKRPEIEKYYKGHISEFQRGPGVKVRQIRVDSIKINKLGREERVPDAKEKAEELRREIVEYGANFADVARDHSDDSDETKKQGGLIVGTNGDPFISMDGRNAAFVKAVEKLKTGEVSKVFQYGEQSYAFVLLEDRREAGPRPLDDTLYDEIYKKLMNNRISRKEDEWFRKAVSTNLIMGIQEGKESKMPLSFFFPDDPDALAADKAARDARKTEAAPAPGKTEAPAPDSKP
ncbi:MAG: peptidyl-prolyl cis-trans isomerase, partial [Planctomycetes bacterium]|nr:peptidyl-prolyl cis-trans isomerase [Planctomycetota bacterium]